jgi:hypothetical protein
MQLDERLLQLEDLLSWLGFCVSDEGARLRPDSRQGVLVRPLGAICKSVC